MECSNFEYGNNITSFFERVSRETCTCYFHNLKFDGLFLVDWLFRNGFEWVEDKKPPDKKFTCLIGDMGQWYQLKVGFGDKLVTFLDSYKIIPLAVEDIPKAYGLPLNKLDLDYNTEREEGHELTQDEISYLSNDVHIVAMALKIIRERGLKKMTAASNALADFKRRLNGRYKYIFPKLDIGVDKDCRLAYKGGWVYVNPKYAGKMVGRGRVYDVNSMYPWAMKYTQLPYGVPVPYQGEYEYDELYPLFIHAFRANIRLKPGRYPSIQLKQSMIYGDTEYITETKDRPIFHLTSVDYHLLFECYDVTDIEHIGGYKFKGMCGIYSEYVDAWYKEKIDAALSENEAGKTIAKLFLNSLYGKEGTNPVKSKKIPYFDKEEDKVKFKISDPEVSKGGYVPVAAFITSWCRDKIIRAANDCGDRFIYADTDSIHIIGDEEPLINISQTELGAFKLENTFVAAKFLRPKTYIEDMGNKLNKKCAGLPNRCRDQLTFDTLTEGHIFKGKLMPKVVPGGVILVEREFKIKG